MQYKIMLKVPEQRAVRIGFTDEISQPEVIKHFEAQGIKPEYIKFVAVKTRELK